jgi:hypothetical protein
VLDLQNALVSSDADLPKRLQEITGKIPGLLHEINVDPKTAQIITQGLVAEYGNSLAQTSKA